MHIETEQLNLLHVCVCIFWLSRILLPIGEYVLQLRLCFVSRLSYTMSEHLFFLLVLFGLFFRKASTLQIA